MSLSLPAFWRKPVPPSDSRAAIALAEQLVADTGEVAGNRIAAQLADLLGVLDSGQLRLFFEWTVASLAPDPKRLSDAARAYLADPTLDRAAQLSAAAEPRRQELFRRLNTAPGGTARIVALRAALVEMLRDAPDLAALDRDLRHLLASWFNRGFLELRRIDWNTPAAILEKLIAYEAVHEIRSWNSLRLRLEGSRRCYAFFHPALPGEPLIFVEIALTDTISDAIAPLIEPGPATLKAAPDTAMFYSISNCQRGLRGISFGNSLIKQISSDLKAELPSLRTFATLSPVPGFRSWLDGLEGAPDLDEPGALAGRCAEYLTRGEARDPVAAFHLGNGARLERINERADLSQRGVAQSHGVMVNYRYYEDQIVANHEAFERGETRVSPAVQALLTPSDRNRSSIFGHRQREMR